MLQRYRFDVVRLLQKQKESRTFATEPLLPAQKSLRVPLRVCRSSSSATLPDTATTYTIRLIFVFLNSRAVELSSSILNNGARTGASDGRSAKKQLVQDERDAPVASEAA